MISTTVKVESHLELYRVDSCYFNFLIHRFKKIKEENTKHKSLKILLPILINNVIRNRNLSTYS